MGLLSMSSPIDQSDRTVEVSAAKHQRSVEALKESEARYRRLLKNLPEIIYSFSIKAGGIYYSPRVMNILGYSPEYLSEHPSLWHDSIHPDDLDMVDKAITELQNGNNFDLEYRIHDANGDWHWFHDRNIVIQEEKGEIVIDGIATDDTKYKQNEIFLRISEDRFRDFASAASDWFWEMGPDLRFSYFSGQAGDRIGISPDTLIRKTRGEVRRVESYDEDWEAHLADLDAHRPFRDFEYEVKQGIFISVSGIPVFRDDGEFLGYRGTGRNITERVIADNQLKQHRDYLEELIAQLKKSRQETLESGEQVNSILNSIHDGFFAVDKQWRLTYANAQAEAVFEHSLEEMEGQILWDIVPEFASAFYRPLTRSMNHQEPTSVEGHYSPLQRWFDMRAYPTKEGLSVYFLDDTDRHMAEDELIHHRDHLQELVAEKTNEVEKKAVELEGALAREKEYNALQQKFVALVSHEFRTPLSIIDGAAQRLIRRKDKLDADEVETRANKVRSAVTRMVGLIDTTLYASSLDAGKIDMKITSCDIQELLLEVCERHSEISPSHQIELMVDDLPCKIFADHRLLDQVFTNLLSNAVKYSPDSPLIEVKGWNDEENALITVTDQGVGIPANDLPHMFGQFFRAKTSEGIKGTGIGLNVVKEFVEMHGGSVGVDSLEGEGSTFTVRIPIGGEDQ